jgi:hypothetical protein
MVRNEVRLDFVMAVAKDPQAALGRLPHVIRLTTITLWHFDAGSGRRPPHQLRPMHRSKKPGMLTGLLLNMKAER